MITAILTILILMTIEIGILFCVVCYFTEIAKKNTVSVMTLEKMIAAMIMEHQSKSKKNTEISDVELDSIKEPIEDSDDACFIDATDEDIDDATDEDIDDATDEDIDDATDEDIDDATDEENEDDCSPLDKLMDSIPDEENIKCVSEDVDTIRKLIAELNRRYCEGKKGKK